MRVGAANRMSSHTEYVKGAQARGSHHELGVAFRKSVGHKANRLQMFHHSAEELWLNSRF